MKNIFSIGNDEDLPLSEIYDSLKKSTYAVLRGIVDPILIKQSVASIKSSFDPDNDNASTGESPSEIMSNFQKLATGGENNRYNNFPRFFGPYTTLSGQMISMG